MADTDERLSRIEKALMELQKAHESAAYEQIKSNIMLSSAINNLSSKLELLQNSVPLKVFAWVFGILVITISGIQGSQWFFEHYLKP